MTQPLPAFSECLNAITTYRNAGGGRDGYKALIAQGMKPKWEGAKAAYETFKADEAVWDGVHAPLKHSPLYHSILRGLDFTANIMGEPFRSAFMIWALEGPYLRPYLQRIAACENHEVHYDLYRAEMLETFGQALNDAGKSRMFDDPRNDAYLARMNDGSWQPITEQEVVALIQGRNAGGPHVFMTANHAFLETMDDVQPIVDGYRKLVDTLTQGRAQWVGADVQPKRADQTVMIAAAHTRENNFLNLAQLFHRLYEIDRANQHGVDTDRFEHVSPIAVQMVRTLLKAVVREPEHIVVDTTSHPPRFVQGDAPLVLRDDAAEVIRNIQYHGFSKGGNDFRDGMRLLARTLHGTLADGRAAFEAPNGNAQMLNDLLSNLSVTVQSMNEKPMDGWYKQRGVSVTYFSNRHDTIALAPDIEFHEHDPAIVYHGTTQHNGHHPDVIMENLSHPYIMQHYRCALAALEEDAAIRFVLFKPMQGRHCLVMRTAPGTTDAMMEAAIPSLEAAFAKVGLLDDYGHSRIRVRRVEGAHGCERYELYSSKGEDDLLSRGVLMKLTEAFDALRYDQGVSTVVSSAITDPCLPTLMKDVVIARRGYEGNPDVDWKDMIRVTGGEIYDRRIAQINKFMGPDPMLLPAEPPHRAVNLEAARGR